MRIDVFAADMQSDQSVSGAFSDWLASHAAVPDFLAVHQSSALPVKAVASAAGDVSALHGATSCLGVMTQKGPFVQDGGGAFAIWDPEGDFGTAVRPLGADSRAAAKAATAAALVAADRSGEAPDVIWLSCSPGTEEDILAGIEDVVGGNVPILGGSAADNAVDGNWLVFSHDGIESQGIAVSVLFPSKPISFAYHSGYAPTTYQAKVTKADGRRLQELDGRPAAEVFRDWTGDTVMPAKVTERTAILSESTLSPLGRHLDYVGGVPFYLLLHPAGVLPDGTVELFADTEVGETLTLMSGAPHQLTQRAGKVAALAAQAGDLQPAQIAGALMVYCGGCMLAVQDQLDDVSSGVVAALPNVPFLGVYTFGEQGMVMGGRNRHGNLMISAIVFAA